MDRCALCPGTANVVPGYGPEQADYFFLAEAPGKDENRKGVPLCLEEGTLVLTLDLTWVPIGSLKVGDQLLAFDEYGGIDSPRKWRVSTVTAVSRSLRKCLRLVTESTVLLVTSEHMVLTDYKSDCKRKAWLPVGLLMLGEKRSSCIASIGVPWESNTDYNSGWLAGFFDGEGYFIIKGKAWYAGFVQNLGPTQEEATWRLESAGFKVGYYGESRRNGKICRRDRVKGGYRETIRFLGSIRPNRLLSRFKIKLAARGHGPEFRTDASRVLSRSPAGEHNVVDITTTTGTFIANGLAVHNCGKTGKEFTEHYLPLAGIHPLQIYKDNCVSCLPKGDGKLDPHEPRDQALIKCCSDHHVYEAIRRVRPKYIITMGGVAASLIPGLDLDIHYAMPFSWDIPGVGQRTVFSTYHPALGLHSPKEMLKLRNCFIRLRKWLRGELVVPQDEYPEPHYTVLSTAEDVNMCFQHYTWGMEDDPDIALDTEVTRDYDPYCLTLSLRPGTARLIKAGSRGALDELARRLRNWRGTILLHNRLFDRPILARMGVYLPPKRIVDTMMEAYHLGNLPQGLKVLAYRQLGVEMHSFDDLVVPYSRAECLKYYSEALGQEWTKPEPDLVRDTDGEWKIYKAQSFGTKLKRFWTDYGKNPNINVFDRWEGWEMHHAEIETKLGRWPGKDIRHAPFEKILPYACRDADVTLRLWPIIKHASTLVRRVGQEAWYD